MDHDDVSPPRHASVRGDKFADVVGRVTRSISSSTGGFMQAADNIVHTVSNADILDGVPMASQAKSFVQALSGDSSGAVQTQENFTRRCVGVSQLRSAFERHCHNEEAAAQTQAEFNRNLRETDQVARQAIASGMSITHDVSQRSSVIAEQAAQQLRGLEIGHRGAVVVEQAAQRLRESDIAQRGAVVVEQCTQRLRESDIGSEFTRNAERGAAVVAGVAQHISQMDLSRHFQDLVQRHPWRSNSSSCGRDGSMRGPIRSLDEYTLHTEADSSQCGTQCPCCLELVQIGESMRVLPCFHVLHHNCAQKWLYAHPICPVCRCDVRTSLEQHRQ